MIGCAAHASDDAANSVDAHLTTCFEINPGILDLPDKHVRDLFDVGGLFCHSGTHACTPVIIDTISFLSVSEVFRMPICSPRRKTQMRSAKRNTWSRL